MRPHCLARMRRQHGLGAEKRRFQVDRDGRIEFGLGQVIDAAHDRDAGIVDENVDRAERERDVIDHLGDGGGLRHVGGDRDGAAALALDAGHDRFGFGGALAVIDRDGGAGLGQRDRNRGADAARAARHQRNVAVQIRLDGHAV